MKTNSDAVSVIRCVTDRLQEDVIKVHLVKCDLISDGLQTLVLKCVETGFDARKEYDKNSSGHDDVSCIIERGLPVSICK